MSAYGDASGSAWDGGPPGAEADYATQRPEPYAQPRVMPTTDPWTGVSYTNYQHPVSYDYQSYAAGSAAYPAYPYDSTYYQNQPGYYPGVRSAYPHAPAQSVYNYPPRTTSRSRSYERGHKSYRSHSRSVSPYIKKDRSYSKKRDGSFDRDSHKRRSRSRSSKPRPRKYSSSNQSSSRSRSRSIDRNSRIRKSVSSESYHSDRSYDGVRQKKSKVLHTPKKSRSSSGSQSPRRSTSTSPIRKSKKDKRVCTGTIPSKAKNVRELSLTPPSSYIKGKSLKRSDSSSKAVKCADRNSLSPPKSYKKSKSSTSKSYQVRESSITPPKSYARSRSTSSSRSRTPNTPPQSKRNKSHSKSQKSSRSLSRSMTPSEISVSVSRRKIKRKSLSKGRSRSKSTAHSRSRSPSKASESRRRSNSNELKRSASRSRSKDRRRSKSKGRRRSKSRERRRSKSKDRRRSKSKDRRRSRSNSLRKETYTNSDSGSEGDDERRGQFTVADRKRYWKLHKSKQEERQRYKSPPKEIKPPPGALEKTQVDDIEYGDPPEVEGPNFADLIPPPDQVAALVRAQASTSKSKVGSLTIKNDGSFLEMFKKMQEETKKTQQENKPEIKKPTLPFIGKRRGGRVLKTGLVKKAKTIEEQTVDNTPKDAWSLYMQEVKKYRETSCEEERKTRPLVK